MKTNTLSTLGDGLTKGHGKGKDKVVYSPKPKIPLPAKKEHPTKDAICHHCGELGYWTMNCPAYLSELIKRKNKTSGASTSGYQKETMGYYFYYPPKNKIIFARNVEFFEKILILQEASGSYADLEEIKDENTHPSKNTIEHHDEVEHKNVEPQSDVIPICSSRIVALLDPKYDKWLKAMNAEMKSMKDNEVWVEVDLPPNAKIVENYEETFSPVVDIKAIRILIAKTVFDDYEI
ncbi:zinc finger, CCHC-type containing protein [Tanacetum coccineum]